jgi:polyisoprenoid-binding protein YceI
MFRRAAALALAAALAAPALRADPPAPRAEEAKAAGTTFHFGVSPSRTTILFESETSLETIHGVTRTMSGTAVLDAEKGAGTAEFRVTVKSMETGVPSRDEHMWGEDWLDEAKHREIAFKAALKRTKTDEASKKETWEYEGEITIKGVAKPLKGEATVQRIPEELGRKLGRGTWIKVKTEFPITIRDFGIEVPEVAAAKVSPTWDVKIDIFGTTEAPKKE